MYIYIYRERERYYIPCVMYITLYKFAGPTGRRRRRLPATSSPVLPVLQYCSTVSQLAKILLRRAPGLKNQTPRRFLNDAHSAPRALLRPFGRSWSDFGRSSGPPSAHLVPLSHPNCVNLAFLTPKFSLASQLSIRFGHKLLSKLVFSSISEPPNLDFCNTLHCF